MSGAGQPDAGTADLDRLLGFTIPGRDARGRVVRLGPLLGEVLAAHDYPPQIRRVLAEALTLTALLGGLLKQDGSQMTMQAQTKGGVIDLLVCDWRGGELRGYVRFDAERLATLGRNPSNFALFGTGYLAITFDLATTEQRYQGIVPLEGDSLADACQAYFHQSEQIPTLIRLGVNVADGACVAGGLLVQHLPEGEEGRERLHVRMDHPEWEHVSILAETVTREELTDPALPLENVLWRLFHEEDEVRTLPGPALSRGCRCSVAHFEKVLSQFPESDRVDMRAEDGAIPVDCAFCSKIFRIAV